MTFSNWLGLTTKDTPEFIDSVIWSDEKLWEEKVHPNKQNERYWGEVDPKVEVDCKVKRGQEGDVLGCRHQWSDHQPLGSS